VQRKKLEAMLIKAREEGFREAMGILRLDNWEVVVLSGASPDRLTVAA
jgi:hypothetical protein